MCCRLKIIDTHFSLFSFCILDDKGSFIYLFKYRGRFLPLRPQRLYFSNPLLDRMSNLRRPSCRITWCVGCMGKRIPQFL
ncbi:hypothetical protein FKM82_023053 [Ascaphus truei]